jgi:hypothetical protein
MEPQKLSLSGNDAVEGVAPRSNTGFQPVRPAGFQPAESAHQPLSRGTWDRQAGSPPDAQAGSLCYAAAIAAPTESFRLRL